MLLFTILGLLVAAGLILSFLEYERYSGAYFFTALTFVVLGITGVFNVATFAVHHPYWFSLSIVGYFAIGVLYAATLKWELFLARHNDKLREVSRAFLRTQNRDGEQVPTELAAPFITYCDNTHFPLYRYPVLAADNKQRIINWMAYWPLSAFWTFCRDAILRAWETAYRHAARYMQARSDSKFGHVTALRAAAENPPVVAPAAAIDPTNSNGQAVGTGELPPLQVIVEMAAAAKRAERNAAV